MSTLNNGINAPTNAFLQINNNLSDVQDPDLCITNLGFTNALVQMGYFSTGSLVSPGSTALPLMSLPTNTSGNLVMSTTYTPLNSTNLLEIEVVAQLSSASNTQGAQNGIALFVNSVTNALAVATFYNPSLTNAVSSVSLKYYMIAGLTSLMTFNVRAGNNISTAIYLNGISGSQVYGGAAASTITIREYTV
jgi:hypothetical protein